MESSKPLPSSCLGHADTEGHLVCSEGHHRWGPPLSSDSQYLGTHALIPQTYLFLNIKHIFPCLFLQLHRKHQGINIFPNPFIVLSTVTKSPFLHENF